MNFKNIVWFIKAIFIIIEKPEASEKGKVQYREMFKKSLIGLLWHLKYFRVFDYNIVYIVVHMSSPSYLVYMYINKMFCVII